MLLGAYLQVMLTKRYTDHRNKLLEHSAKVAVESIENVFTVATLGIEKRLVDNYNQLLEHPFRYVLQNIWMLNYYTLFDFRFSLKCSAINNVIYGFSISVVPFTVGFAYIVGAYMNTSDESKVYYSDYAEIFL